MDLHFTYNYYLVFYLKFISQKSNTGTTLKYLKISTGRKHSVVQYPEFHNLRSIHFPRGKNYGVELKANTLGNNISLRR